MSDPTVEYLELALKMQTGLLFKLVDYFGKELEPAKLLELHTAVKDSLLEIHSKSQKYIEGKIINADVPAVP